MLCRSENLTPFLDLGFHPHSDQFRTDPMRPEMTYLLGLQFCNDCKLVQLTYLVGREELFTEDYLYESSITETANKHWQEFADDVCETVKPTGLVVEIGSNDGTLLKKFQEKGLEVIGVDPCKEIADIANKRGIPTIVNFFNGQVVSALNRKASLVIGSNVFAHLDDYQKFGRNIKKLLADDGVLVLESPYVMNTIEGIQYDQVYHQHMLYTGLIPLKKYFEKLGMEIFDVKFTPIHGGSFRCYIARKGTRPLTQSSLGSTYGSLVMDAISSELVDISSLSEFAVKVQDNRYELIAILNKFANEGKTIIAVSSPAKGQTLLNYTGAGKYLAFATDKSKLKQGRYTPGTHLLIKDDSEIPEGAVGLLLAWNFKDEIIKNNPKIKTWIIPNPTPIVVEL